MASTTSNLRKNGEKRLLIGPELESLLILRARQAEGTSERAKERERERERETDRQSDRYEASILQKSYVC